MTKIKTVFLIHMTRINMPPTSKKLRGHIGLGLSVLARMRPFITLCIRSRTVRYRILKLNIWTVAEQ